MSVAISIDNVIKRFGKDTIINGLSLDVRPGEFFTLAFMYLTTSSLSSSVMIFASISSIERNSS